MVAALKRSQRPLIWISGHLWCLELTGRGALPRVLFIQAAPGRYVHQVPCFILTMLLDRPRSANHMSQWISSTLLHQKLSGIIFFLHNHVYNSGFWPHPYMFSIFYKVTTDAELSWKQWISWDATNKKSGQKQRESSLKSKSTRTRTTTRWVWGSASALWPLPNQRQLCRLFLFLLALWGVERWATRQIDQ